MERGIDNRAEDQWQTLLKVMPQASGLDKALRDQLYGLVRRSLLLEHQEAQESARIFHPDDVQALRTMQESLPVASEQEILQTIGELQLSPEEGELEFAHWAFRRQSASGELLLGEQLVKFKLVRLHDWQYLLLCEQYLEAVVRCFERVFKRPADCFLPQPLRVGPLAWSAWMWITDSDPDRARIMRADILSRWQV
ncbi:hypothetical protein JW933_10355 [candidate division FCPU426 bacterium]|nr:hypothetical protein [candidate division FCPU426 bacterium]